MTSRAIELPCNAILVSPKSHRVKNDTAPQELPKSNWEAMRCLGVRDSHMRAVAVLKIDLSMQPVASE
jgi:hypothetical protein